MPVNFFDSYTNNLQILAVNDQGELSIFDFDGNELSSFIIPSFLEGHTLKPPVVLLTDLNDDGLQEIVVKTFISDGNDYSANQLVRAYESDGTILWERNMAPPGFNATYPMPIVSDLNADGNNEIIASDMNGLWIFNKDGEDVSEWPYYEKDDILNLATGDANGDNLLEIYYSQSFPPFLGSINEGVEVFNFPLQAVIVFDPPLISDIDLDNHLEMIIALPFGGPVQVYDLGPSVLNHKFRTGWPQFQFNESRISQDGICLKFSCDLNRDGIVNIDDGTFFSSCYSQCTPLGNCRTVDVSGNGNQADVCDGCINLVDYSLLNLECPQIFQTPTPFPTPVPIPGDADGNGTVDDADYTHWLCNYLDDQSTCVYPADFDASGAVDGLDYNIWRSNYGFGVPTITPEPSGSYPVNLTATFDGNYTIQYDWNPPADSDSSLYIWNGECKSGTYGPGDLLWSQPTNINTNYTYTYSDFQPGDTICAQIWKNFFTGEVQSNEESITKPGVTIFPTPAPFSTPTPIIPTPTPVISTPTPAVSISCSVHLSPSIINVAYRSSTLVIANVDTTGPVSNIQVDFSTANSRFATFSPTSDSSYPYQSSVSGRRRGITTAYANVYLNSQSTPSCSQSAYVSVY